MQMPGLSGVELLRKITERYPDTAVIMISGIDRTQRVIDAIRVGAYDYLIKPCELDVLALCVERAMGRRTLLRNARRYKQDLEKRNAELARQQLSWSVCRRKLCRRKRWLRSGNSPPESRTN